MPPSVGMAAPSHVIAYGSTQLVLFPRGALSRLLTSATPTSPLVVFYRGTQLVNLLGGALATRPSIGTLRRPASGRLLQRPCLVLLPGGVPVTPPHISNIQVASGHLLPADPVGASPEALQRLLTSATLTSPRAASYRCFELVHLPGVAPAPHHSIGTLTPPSVVPAPVASPGGDPTLLAHIGSDHTPSGRFLPVHPVCSSLRTTLCNASFRRHACAAYRYVLPAHLVGASSEKDPTTPPYIGNAHVAPGRVLPGQPVGESLGRGPCHTSFHRHA